MDVFRMKCSDFDTANLPDYRKGVYGVTSNFGVSLNQVDTKCHFALVVYQHKRSINSVMVEIVRKPGYWDDGGKDLVPIPFETLKKLTSNHFHNLIVECKGHALIKGMKSENFTSLRPSFELCKWTNAFDFLKQYGNALATALAYADDVHDLDEGEEFNACIADIQNFVNEMKETGLYACGIRNATERIKDIQEDMVEEDKSTRENYETWQSAVDTLAQYGIEYKRDKDEAVWP
jgi:hypothetical protein